MKTLLSTTALLLTLGFSSAALAHSEWYGKEGQDGSASYMEGAIHKLPKDDAAQFRDTMKAARDSNKPLQDQIEKLHGELHDILTAPTFDKTEFLARRNEIQQLHGQMETNMVMAFASAVSELSQEERVTLTRALHREHTKHHKGHHKTSSEVPAAPKPAIADTAPSKNQ